MGGWMDGRMDGWMDRIFPPVFYRTSSPIGSAAQKGEYHETLLHTHKCAAETDETAAAMTTDSEKHTRSHTYTDTHTHAHARPNSKR